MFLNKMESVIYNQDLFRYICGFLKPVDTLVITKLNKEIRDSTKNILPKYYGKINHLEKLKEKYDFEFLQDCVQTFLQAQILFKVYNCSTKYAFEGDTPYKGIVRQVYNLLRFRRWKRKGHLSTNRINKKIKLLKVL